MLHEVRDEGDGLDGFPQAHLVGQDPVQVVVVERDQPLQAFDLTDRDETQGRLWNGAAAKDVPGRVRLLHLILLELPVDQQGGLLVHLLGDGVSDRVVGLQPSGKGRTAVFVIHVLLGVSVGKRQRAPFL